MWRVGALGHCSRAGESSVVPMWEAAVEGISYQSPRAFVPKNNSVETFIEKLTEHKFLLNCSLGDLVLIYAAIKLTRLQRFYRMLNTIAQKQMAQNSALQDFHQLKSILPSLAKIF